MKRLFPPAALKLLAKQRGFSLIEVLLGCFLIILVVGIVLPNISSFSSNIDAFRAKNLAYMLASDIRRVQLIDMYRGRDYYAINFDERNNRYHISKGLTSLSSQYVAAHLNDSWGLKAVNKQNIFYMRGSVNVYNYIDIINRNTMRGYRVQVLPVSGRIGVHKQ